jgi:hypothetical protein
MGLTGNDKMQVVMMFFCKKQLSPEQVHLSQIKYIVITKPLNG